ncbi:PIG-L family deacetylase [Patescibacteria group bacterium]|nr:PIG-L family deacetylase [Patescibacteria group bacterium]
MKEEFKLSNTDRILIVSPHPDDETLCAGGLIQRIANSKIPIKIIFMTNGDRFISSFKFDTPFKRINTENLLDFGKKRQREAISALNILGIDKKDIIFLSLPDKAIKGLYLKNEINSLINILNSFNPTKIVYPTEIDRHKDHKFTSLIVKKYLSLENLNPEKYTYLTHHKLWPIFQNKKNIYPPKTLSGNTWVNLYLSESEKHIKSEALSQYKTQKKLTFPFFKAFEKNNELFIKEKD